MKDIKGFILGLLPYIVILVVVLLIKQFIFTNVVVHGSSMEDTLHNKDIMIMDKIGIKIRGIKRFDIVVVKGLNEKLIKRVIGLPGETIEYKDNELYVNGKKVKDNHGGEKVTSDIKPITLGKNEYYVLGDNRTNSVDSRILGPIEKKDIIGRATFTIFPLNRIGSR